MKKHPDLAKQSSKRLIKEEIKKQLKDSFVYNEKSDKEDQNARVNAMEDYQETMNIIEEHEKIIKTNKNNIIHFA